VNANPVIPSNHDDCPEYLRRMALVAGTAVTVSTEPPIVTGPYTTDPFVCPHDVKYWVEPTGEQIAQWAKDGVR